MGICDDQHDMGPWPADDATISPTEIIVDENGLRVYPVKHDKNKFGAILADYTIPTDRDFCDDYPKVRAQLIQLAKILFLQEQTIGEGYTHIRPVGIQITGISFRVLTEKRND